MQDFHMCIKMCRTWWMGWILNLDDPPWILGQCPTVLSWTSCRANQPDYIYTVSLLLRVWIITKFENWTGGTSVSCRVDRLSMRTHTKILLLVYLSSYFFLCYHWCKVSHYDTKAYIYSPPMQSLSCWNLSQPTPSGFE